MKKLIAFVAILSIQSVFADQSAPGLVYRGISYIPRSAKQNLSSDEDQKNWSTSETFLHVGDLITLQHMGATLSVDDQGALPDFTDDLGHSTKCNFVLSDKKFETVKEKAAKSEDGKNYLVNIENAGSVQSPRILKVTGVKSEAKLNTESRHDAYTGTTTFSIEDDGGAIDKLVCTSDVAIDSDVRLEKLSPAKKLALANASLARTPPTLDTRTLNGAFVNSAVALMRPLRKDEPLDKLPLIIDNDTKSKMNDTHI